MDKIIILDKYFFKNFKKEQIFNFLRPNIFKGFHLVSLVDIDLLNKAHFPIETFKSVTSSSKYGPLTSGNWQKAFNQVTGLSPKGMEIITSLPQLNEYLLKIS